MRIIGWDIVQLHQLYQVRLITYQTYTGMGHWAWGIGHGALGMGHWANRAKYDNYSTGHDISRLSVDGES
jgi:hypothetical protein